MCCFCSIAGVPCRTKSPKDGLSEYAKVNYQMGCDSVACKNDTFIFGAMEAARTSDATVIFVGIDLSVEAESLDRVDLLLPGYQTQLVQQVATVSKGPVVLVILSAGGIDISFAKNNSNIKAIIWAGYPGEEGGRAIAEVIFGKYNPGQKDQIYPNLSYQSKEINEIRAKILLSHFRRKITLDMV